MKTKTNIIMNQFINWIISMATGFGCFWIWKLAITNVWVSILIGLFASAVMTTVLEK